MQDDDYSGQATDQVTICRWDGCTLHDLGNMDELVRHVHDDHIGPKPKRYTCEWIDCPRKGQTHASGYALRAHMRSHTREKPFFCSVPGEYSSIRRTTCNYMHAMDGTGRIKLTDEIECDRSFTRSDALTKHMRTVHEPDTPRPAEKHQVQRIKLKLSQPKDESQTQAQESQPQSQPDKSLDTTPGDTNTNTLPLEEIDLPETAGPELGFDAHELSLAPRDLFRLLRRQIHWAEKEGQQLRAEWDGIRPQRKQMWMEKEAISDDAADAEMRLFKILMDGESAAPAAPAAPSAPAATGTTTTAGDGVQLEKSHQHHPAYQSEPGPGQTGPPEQRYLGVDVKPNPA